MSSSVVFEDIVAVKIDNRGKTPPTVSGGHPLIEVNALVNCGLHPDIKKVSKFVDVETWSTWFRQHLMEGDVVFSTVGTIGETAIVSSGPNYAIAQNILGFRFKKDLVSPLYMLYLMRSSWLIHQITGRTIETVQKSIKWSDMRGIKLDLPSVDTQEKIAKILGDLDRKIELNRRMNETLEQIGQTLFKKYFIDNPESEGWNKGDISKFASNVRDNLKPPFPVDINYVALEHFTSGTLSLYEFASSEGVMSNKTKFRKHDILFGKLRPYFHNVAIAPFDGMCSTDVLAIRPKNDDYFSFVSYFLSQKSLIDYVTQSSEGTKMPRTSWKNICNYEFHIPDDESLKSFNKVMKPLLYCMLKNVELIKTLKELRDALLPKLMSEEISV